MTLRVHVAVHVPVCSDADLGRGRVTVLADPGVTRLLGRLLEWWVQAAEVIA